MTGEHWQSEPEAHDYPAAESYLTLLIGRSSAARLVGALQAKLTLEHFAAKDILRAAGLPLLAADDTEVAADLEKVRHGKKLSPVLLAEGDPLWIADGYHRVCASYHLDEKAQVPCRIVARAPGG
ncbi:MAG TPA: hypothetical protein VFX25_30810 [Streptosporangiaceae bacterium]|nr:hypothetical protein [Streptosporangiaceae bacterium]